MLSAAETDGVPGARLGVLGSPIRHSRSPRIHRAAYERLGLDWSYDAFECEVPDLAAFLAGRDDAWRGFSVTMPLKEEAFRLCAVRDPVAEESGVVNTLLRVAGGGSTGVWAGFNTDVAGLAGALTHTGFDFTRPLVLGSGATAVSALMALRGLGAAVITVSARRDSAARVLAARFDSVSLPVRSAPLAELRSASVTAIISTLPGPAGVGLPLPADLTRLPLFDVAYDPWPSPLATRWSEAGGVATAGLPMLVEQALIQVRIFRNGDPDSPLPDEAGLRDVMVRAAHEPGVGG